MATFYVLPPRACLEESIASLVSKLLPGLPVPVDAWDAVVDRLATDAAWPADLFLVPRDDLPAGEDLTGSLAEHFGAEPGDRVVEIVAGGSRHWLIGPAVSASAAA